MTRLTRHVALLPAVALAVGTLAACSAGVTGPDVSSSGAVPPSASSSPSPSASASGAGAQGTLIELDAAGRPATFAGPGGLGYKVAPLAAPEGGRLALVRGRTYRLPFSVSGSGSRPLPGLEVRVTVGTSAKASANPVQCRVAGPKELPVGSSFQGTCTFTAPEDGDSLTVSTVPYVTVSGKPATFGPVPVTFELTGE